MVPVGYTWLRQTFGLSSNQSLSTNPIWVAALPSPIRRTDAKPRRQQSRGAGGFIGYSSVKSVVKNSGF